MMLITCPGCGWKAKVEKRPKPPCPNCGALALKGHRHIKVWMKTAEAGISPNEARVAAYGGLVWLGLALQYKPGWASVKYKKLYGCWPDRNWLYVGVPSPALVGWVLTDKAKHAAIMRKIDEQEASAEIGEGRSDPGQSHSQDDAGMA